MKDSFKHVDTMIGADAVIQGDVLLKGGAIISGKVFGNVVTKGPVRITRTGYVKGDIKAADAYLGGVVQGNVRTTGKVVLQSHSKVAGDLVYHRLVIEDGAQFAGKCDIIFTNDTGKTSPSSDRKSAGVTDPTPQKTESKR